MILTYPRHGRSIRNRTSHSSRPLATPRDDRHSHPRMFRLRTSTGRNQRWRTNERYHSAPLHASSYRYVKREGFSNQAWQRLLTTVNLLPRRIRQQVGAPMDCIIMLPYGTESFISAKPPTSGSSFRPMRYFSAKVHSNYRTNCINHHEV